MTRHTRVAVALQLFLPALGACVEDDHARDVEPEGGDRAADDLWLDAVVSSGPSSAALPAGVITIGPGDGRLELHFAYEDGYLADLDSLDMGLEYVAATGEVFAIPAATAVAYSVGLFHHGDAALPGGTIGTLRATVNERVVESPAMVYVPVPGDADLDFDFDSADLTAVFAAGKYETGLPATWNDGDWNGDGLFDSGDMVDALAAGHYERGPIDTSGLEPSPEQSTDDHTASLPPAFDDPRVECAGECFLVARDKTTPPRETVTVDATCSPLRWELDDEDYGGEHESDLAYDQNSCAWGPGDSACYSDGHIDVTHEWQGSFETFAECVYYRRAGTDADACADRSCSLEIESHAHAETDVSAGNDMSTSATANAEASVVFQMFDANDRSSVVQTLKSTAKTDVPSCGLLDTVLDAAYVDVSCSLVFPPQSSKCEAKSGLKLTYAQFLDAIACIAGQDDSGDYIPRHRALLEYDTPQDNRTGLADVPSSGSQASLGPTSLTASSSYQIVRNYDFDEHLYPYAGARTSVAASLQIEAKGAVETGADKAELACAISLPRPLHDGETTDETIDPPSPGTEYGAVLALSLPKNAPQPDPDGPTQRESCDYSDLCGDGSVPVCADKQIGDACGFTVGDQVKTCAPMHEGYYAPCECSFHD